MFRRNVLACFCVNRLKYCEQGFSASMDSSFHGKYFCLGYQLQFVAVALKLMFLTFLLAS